MNPKSADSGASITDVAQAETTFSVQGELQHRVPGGCQPLVSAAMDMPSGAFIYNSCLLAKYCLDLILLENVSKHFVTVCFYKIGSLISL